MICKKNIPNCYCWVNSKYQFHKFSGPHAPFLDGDLSYGQYDYYHRLYGFAHDWKNSPNWLVNNKNLNAFKGSKK